MQENAANSAYHAVITVRLAASAWASATAVFEIRRCPLSTRDATVASATVVTRCSLTENTTRVLDFNSKDLNEVSQLKLTTWGTPRHSKNTDKLVHVVYQGYWRKPLKPPL